MGESTDPTSSAVSATGTRTPRVSVILPAFNGEQVIAATLRSLAAQESVDADWVVIDDASHDGTCATVQAFLEHAPVRARLLRHPENWGLSRTLNHGIRESSEELVLIVHQDISLGSVDWIARAINDLDRDPTVAVVTGNYGIPVLGEVDFVQRVFGVLRRQFHRGPDHGVEYATFTEFKCDVIRRSALSRVGGFPERFRIAGEDLWVSYALREQGQRILKDFSLQSVQRFTGDSTTIRGNFRKEFLFGKVLTGTLLRFRSAVARGLGKTPYSRSRSWNRASQPIVVLAVLALLAVALLAGSWWWWAALAGVVLARYAYYSVRLFPDLRAMVGSDVRATGEALVGSFVGLVSDVVYSAGLVAGLFRWNQGGPV